MHAYGIRDLHHCHRFKESRAVLKKFALPFYDLVRDIGNRLLALMDRFDQEFSAADLVADVIFHFAAVAVLRHDVLVSVADAQVRDLFTV